MSVQPDPDLYFASSEDVDLYNLLCPVMGPRTKDERDPDVNSGLIVLHPFLKNTVETMKVAEALRNISAPGQVTRHVCLSDWTVIHCATGSSFTGY